MASPSGHHNQDPTGQGQGQGQSQNQNQNQGQPQGRRFSYASVAAGAEHPPPRSHANPSDNAYTWLRGHIPGSSHQLPDPDITNYMFYETGMDMFIRPSDNMYGSGFSMSPDNTMAASALAFARGLDPGSATAHPPAPALLPAPAAVPPPTVNR
ncbi:hypothetical protein KEM55_009326 [Ascosphaera atra]|nr:hypothetical protein KEM55_009326 [Ascosphaera atra]